LIKNNLKTNFQHKGTGCADFRRETFCRTYAGNHLAKL